MERMRAYPESILAKVKASYGCGVRPICHTDGGRLGEVLILFVWYASGLAELVTVVCVV